MYVELSVNYTGSHLGFDCCSGDVCCDNCAAIRGSVLFFGSVLCLVFVVSCCARQVFGEQINRILICTVG